MRRLATAATQVFLALLAVVGSALAQPKLVKEQLFGTWHYVSTVNTRPDGTRFEPYGGAATGALMFDSDGHFSWQVIRPDIPKFASDDRMYGTLEDFKAVGLGVLSFFGTYVVEDDGALTMHIVASSFPNFNNQDQRRTIRLVGDELTITNQISASGGTSEYMWRRLPASAGAGGGRSRTTGAD